MSSKPPYILTDTGNKISRRCTTCAPQNIILGGKTIIQPNSIIRGDLRRGGGTGASAMIVVGKYSVVGEGAVLRPPAKTYKHAFSYYPVSIGEHVSIGAGTISEAASIGNGVEIGKNCIIGPFSIIHDYAKIADGSVLGPRTIVPSLTEWAGNPARPIGTLPESTPEQVEARARTFYTRFQPE